MRLADAPTHSVVLASRSDRAHLDRCLATLLPRCHERGAEVVVARTFEPDEYQDLERSYPSVLFMPAPVLATDRQLRLAGFSAADGDIVHLVDDREPLAAVWFERLGAPGVAAGVPAES